MILFPMREMIQWCRAMEQLWNMECKVSCSLVTPDQALRTDMPGSLLVGSYVRVEVSLSRGTMTTIKIVNIFKDDEYLLQEIQAWQENFTQAMVGNVIPSASMEHYQLGEHQSTKDVWDHHIVWLFKYIERWCSLKHIPFFALSEIEGTLEIAMSVVHPFSKEDDLLLRAFRDLRLASGEDSRIGQALRDIERRWNERFAMENLNETHIS